VRLLALAAPLFLAGTAAGLLRALALRPGLPPRRRRTLQAAWILTLLLGVPLWLVAAALLGLW